MKRFLNLKRYEGRRAQWRACLIQFYFEVQHRFELKHMTEDAYSPMSTNQANDFDLIDDIETCDITDVPAIADGKVEYEEKPLKF